MNKRKNVEQENRRTRIKITYNDDDNDNNDDNNKNKDIYDKYDESNLLKQYIPKCASPLCDHKYNSKFVPNLIQKEVTSIDDLIEYGKLYHCKNFKYYKGIDLKILFNLIEPLTELSKLIGMKEVKENMVNQILFFLQKLNQRDNCMQCKNCILNLRCYNTNELNREMLHTVITGPPGTGKTELGKILGKVYKALGILSTGHFNIATRSDLIAKYLGQTAIKTQEFIDKCEGGVMFIDEAYALGNPELRDSFSKECLDTLNQNLTEKRNFLCVIAGYEEALESSFFAFNEGLKRRFSFRYNIKGYDADELKQMFLLRIKNESWFYIGTDEELTDFFKKHKDKFPRFGGDIETLFLKTKIFHSRRIMFKDESERKKIIMDDIKKGFDNFISHREKKEEELPKHLFSMYS
jgi:SpoVK/Ycf46/Vps4 family AAA+-type ATPase